MKVSGSKALLLLIICTWSKNVLIAWILQIFRFIPLLGSYIDFFYYIIILFLVIISLPELSKYLRMQDILLAFICIIAYTINYAINDSNPYLKEGISLFFFNTLPCYYLGLAINIHSELSLFGLNKKLEEWFYVASVVGIIVNFMYQLYNLIFGAGVGYINSSSSTYTLCPLCFVTYYAFFKGRKFSWFVYFLGLFAMLSYAIRTNLLAVLIMTFFMAMLKSSGDKKKIQWTIAFGVLIGILFFYFDDLIFYGMRLFTNIGLSTRIFNSFLTNNLFNLSNRENVYDIAISYIKERPYTGYGFFGDRVYFGGMDGYCHNLFLELIFDFGIPLGMVLSVFLLYLFMKGYKYSGKSISERGLFLCLFSAEFVMLMTSGSYLVQGFFFLLIGYCVRLVRTSKNV